MFSKWHYLTKILLHGKGKRLTIWKKSDNHCNFKTAFQDRNSLKSANPEKKEVHKSNKKLVKHL